MTSHAPAAPAVVLVLGLQEAPVRWLTRRLREHGVVATALSDDLPTTAAQSVCAAADAAVHLFSAVQGIDGRHLGTWQLLAEAGKARFVLIHDLGPTTLDVNEAAAIASRVLEEDVVTTTLPLLDDDETVIGVLDVITGAQSLPDGSVEGPREDFNEAVEAETNTIYDAAEGVDEEPATAIRDGLLTAAATLDLQHGAGLHWLVQHLPPRTTPIATTVMPGDDPGVVLLAAGPQGCAAGPAQAVTGGDSHEVDIESLADLFAPRLQAFLPPGAVAAARCTPVPQIGSWVV